MSLIKEWCDRHGLHPQCAVLNHKHMGVTIDGHDYYAVAAPYLYENLWAPEIVRKHLSIIENLSMMDKIYLRRIQYTYHQQIVVRPIVKSFTNPRMQVMFEGETSSLTESIVIGSVTEHKLAPRYFDRAIIDIDYTIVGIDGMSLYCVVRDPPMTGLQAVAPCNIDTVKFTWTSDSDLQNQNLSL